MCKGLRSQLCCGAEAAEVQVTIFPLRPGSDLQGWVPLGSARIHSGYPWRWVALQWLLETKAGGRGFVPGLELPRNGKPHGGHALRWRLPEYSTDLPLHWEGPGVPEGPPGFWAPYRPAQRPSWAQSCVCKVSGGAVRVRRLRCALSSLAQPWH